MRIINLFTGLIFLASFFLNQKIYSQCKPCTIPATRVTPDDAILYRRNYINNYHTTTERKKTHSISVDFSRESIIAFYDKVFIADAGKGYQGININFISFGKSFLPRQKHNDQIGLMITATDTVCMADPYEFNMYNNSFNQTKKYHDYTPATNYCSRTEYIRYTANYYNIYAKGNPKNYTLYVHYNLRVIKLLYDFLIANPSFTGFRFSFASYNKPRVACGQASDTQITLLLTPVSADGDADDKTFFEYLSSNFSESDLKTLLVTLNHGELCPDLCY